MKKTALVLILFYSVISYLQADNTVPFSENRHAVSICIGTDFSLVTIQINYTQSFYAENLNRDIILDSGISFPLFKPDLADFRIHTGIKMNSVQTGNFHIPVSLKLLFRSHSNAAYRSTGFGIEFALNPGYFNDIFAAAAEIILDTEILTHIKHSNYYKNTIYRDALSGWYAFTSDTFRIGARTGILIGGKDEIFLRGGYEYHGNYNLKIPPFYAITGNNVRF